MIQTIIPQSRAADRISSQQFLPNVFILGAAKSATTTLAGLLGNVAETCLSAEKEPWFFECEFERGLEYCRRQYFSHWQGERVIFEARHRNLYLPWVPARIHQVNPNAKLIVVVRNPIDRAYSHWWYWCNHGRERDSFSVAIRKDYERICAGKVMQTEEERRQYYAAMEVSRRINSDGYGIYRTYLDSGYYLEQMQRYLELFPRENMHVILFDDVIRNQQQTLSELLDFIGVPPETVAVAANTHGEKKEPLTSSWIRALSNRQTTRRLLPYVPQAARQMLRIVREKTASWPEMDSDTRSWLREHYRPHVDALQKFVGRDLSHWQ